LSDGAVMLLYSKTITPRLQYICDFIGNDLTGKSISITTDRNLYEKETGPRINYSDTLISPDEFWLKPHSLLFEKGILSQVIDCFDIAEYKGFYRTDGDFPFDFLAASFYLLSRYEEYLPHKKDIYGRYGHENSLAFKEGFLNKPLINIWMQEFKRVFQQKFPSFSIHHSHFTFLPTYDIDEAYSYKHKGWKRTGGAMLKDLFRGELKKLVLRGNVINGKARDPFDSYEWMDSLHDEFRLKPRYFFLVAQRISRYDRNILPGKTALKALIWRHASKYEIGVHPSWQSGDEPSLIKTEKTIVAETIGFEIISSRQHFIRLVLPQTYRHLTEAGIMEDFSMGYGSINGFRASVASPFYWYDLEKEETTGLLLYPFCYMEANSFYEQKYSPQKALEEMKWYYNEVKRVNGTLITIWHNTFLGTDERFVGWKDVYAEFIKEVADKRN